VTIIIFNLLSFQAGFRVRDYMLLFLYLEKEKKEKKGSRGLLLWEYNPTENFWSFVNAKSNLLKVVI